MVGTITYCMCICIDGFFALMWLSISNLYLPVRCRPCQRLLACPTRGSWPSCSEPCSPCPSQTVWTHCCHPDCYSHMEQYIETHRRQTPIKYHRKYLSNEPHVQTIHTHRFVLSGTNEYLGISFAP